MVEQKDIEQSQRFIEKAKEIGADKSIDVFERVFKKIVPPKLKKKSEPVAPSVLDKNV